VGFHAQQAVEKCLKAVLAQHRVEVHKTHDLRALLDLLVERNLPIPTLAENWTT
jgi:HEPN domain-containing protein